ncbi:MAG: hypothetical protein WB626_06050 [Bacteroidota bacterium]
MQVLSLIWGIVAITGMMVAFIPCLGALNWLNIPFSLAGLIVSAVALGNTGDGPKGGSIAGLVLCIAAAFFGFIRLILGCGVL